MSGERYMSKVTVKGQVTIPREIRDRLELELKRSGLPQVRVHQAKMRA